MKSYIDKAADDLIKLAEQRHSFKKMSSKGAGVASLLSGKDEVELLLEQVKSDLPVLYLRLNERRTFFASKDANNGNVINITKDIKKTEDYLDMLEKTISLHNLREINDFVYMINDKYSFDV